LDREHWSKSLLPHSPHDRNNASSEESVMDDRILKRVGVFRIYDILFDHDVLLSTDAF
jgi:hypothetical protein